MPRPSRARTSTGAVTTNPDSESSVGRRSQTGSTPHQQLPGALIAATVVAALLVVVGASGWRAVANLTLPRMPRVHTWVGICTR